MHDQVVDLRIEWLRTFCSRRIIESRMRTSQPIYPSCASQDVYDLELLFQKRELASWNGIWRYLEISGDIWRYLEIYNSWIPTISNHQTIKPSPLKVCGWSSQCRVPWRCWCFSAVTRSVDVRCFLGKLSNITVTSIFMVTVGAMECFGPVFHIHQVWKPIWTSQIGTYDILYNII